MLQRNRTLCLLLSFTGVAVSAGAFGHGALVDPPARQVLCYQQGALSGICKEASEKSYDRGQSIYTWQELTGFVGGTHSAEEAKKTIPDHLICSGTSKGAGFNLASASWKTTQLKPDASGKVTMRYGYTQPHAPSWIEFYITKKDVDPTTKVIGWNDVELLATVVSSEETVAISGMTPPYTSYDEYQIEIPADRTGRAVIFSRWQRQDANNEGFYGCSDVIISERGSDFLPAPGHEHHHDTTTPADWFEYSKFAATQNVQVEDRVTFRLMGETGGGDLVKIRKPITRSNADGQWISELAAEINKNHSSLVQIGEKSQSGVIQFNPQQPRSNRIFLNHKGYSAVLSVEAPSTAPLAIVPANLVVESPRSTPLTYLLDGSNSRNAQSYRWKIISSQGTFGLQDQQGGDGSKTVNKSVAQAVIPANTTGSAIYELTVTSKEGITHASRVTVTVKEKQAGSTDYPAWQPDHTYVAGDKVTFDGVKYIASYWTQAQPGEHDSWKLADNSQIVEWKATMTYVAGNTVSWQGKRYRAKQWTVGHQPDRSPAIWQLK